MTEELSLMQITRQQADQITQLTALVRQFSTVVMAMDRRMEKLERLLDRKVTIEVKQYKAIQKAIKERGKELCEKYRLDLKEAGKTIRKAITVDLQTRYGVTDLHDLPDNYFDIVLQEIAGFTSYALICKLRGK